MAFAGELEDLGFSDDTDQAVTVARLPRPISQVAENTTVITADDISRLNAHTLADILQTVPGFQMDYQRTPGAISGLSMQGALPGSVLLLIDGVRQNEFSWGYIFAGQIPVQIIDRIEITKGPGSSFYGASSAGVINIITKSPDPDRKASGMVSGSVGSKFTADSRAELSGTVDRLGYYINAGNLRSDGLRTNTAVDQSNFYSKFVWSLPADGKLSFGLYHLLNHAGVDGGDARPYQVWFGDASDNNRGNRSYGFLSLVQPLTPHLTLDVDTYLASLQMQSSGTSTGSDITPYAYVSPYDSQARGVNSRLNWQQGGNSLVFGAEYGHVGVSNQYADIYGSSTNSRSWDSWATYGNAALNWGKLTILPGVRYDSTGINGNFTSYTLGATYQLPGSTTLRTYFGNGFSLPRLGGGQVEKEKTKTVQAGVETGAVPYVWLKGTYFFNAVRDVSQGTLNQDRQGVEVEVRTVPVAGLSLSTGYTYQHVKDADSGLEVHTDSNQAVPPHLLKLALRYDNADLGLRGTLTGNWLFWNAGTYTYQDANFATLGTKSYPVSDQGMIWNLHLNWKTQPENELSPEVFFSVRNIFNGSQSAQRVLEPSEPRWFEGGVRLRF
jgi:vitamin B12 transporter